MSIEYDVLDLDEVAAEFLYVGETIDDLSLIRLTLVKDTHWDCLEMNLLIYGTGDPDIECPVLEIPIDAEVLLLEGMSQGISCQKLSALFAEDLLETIREKDVPVIFNLGDKTEALIDLSKPGNEILLPMIR
jgi:hypothetical protein